MKILVACEESQAVTKELRELGHEAYSNDILPTSGDNPEWHIQGDTLKLLNEDWDMIIAFPPCTHLAVSGARHFEGKRNDGRQRDAIEFFMSIINSKCPMVAVENPVGIMSGNYIKKHFPDLAEKYNLPIKTTQYIQPYEYGSEVTKKTGLWLRGLPELKPTNIVGKGEVVTFKSGKKMHSFFANSYGDGGLRSKTFPGIAKAMAEQWGGVSDVKKQLTILDNGS